MHFSCDFHVNIFSLLALPLIKVMSWCVVVVAKSERKTNETKHDEDDKRHKTK